VSKLVNAEDFAKAVKNYEMLPLFAINIVAIILPYIELFSGIFLIIGYCKKGNSAILGISLIVFLIALTSAYARGLNIDCGCGFTTFVEASTSKTDLLVRIFEDIMMLIGIVVICIFSDTKQVEETKIEIKEEIQQNI
jgi:uncharacterized membrane protein YphA (DoxX/SURF4 family)